MSFQEDAAKAFHSAFNQPLPKRLSDLLEEQKARPDEAKRRIDIEMSKQAEVSKRKLGLADQVQNLEDDYKELQIERQCIVSTLMVNWGPDDGHRPTRRTPVLLDGSEPIMTAIAKVFEYYTVQVHGDPKQANNDGVSGS